MKFIAFTSNSDHAPTDAGWDEGTPCELMPDGSLLFDLRNAPWTFLKLVPVREAPPED